MPSVGSFLNTKINFILLAVKKELFLNTSSGVNKTQSLKKEPQLFFLSWLLCKQMKELLS